MYLEEIIKNEEELESRSFECKQKLNRDNVIGWLKTIAGFANCEGGTLYIGVQDGTNKLMGFNGKEADSERNFLNNQINQHLFPRPEMRVAFIKYTVRNKEMYIIQVKISESHVKPIITKFNQVPSIFMRRDGFTDGATYEEIINMSIRSSKIQFDKTETDVKYRKDNFVKLQTFCAEHANGKRLTDKELQACDFYDKNKLLRNGAVLFADDYTGDKTSVQCSVFAGFNKGSNRVITINKYQGCITDVIDYITNFVKQRMNYGFTKLPDSRVNSPAFPERALFEGVVNAVAHRDYYLDGTQIQVDMFKDRLEISSPGSFFQGDSIGKTYDLSKIISKRRNDLICEVLVKCNVMEASGTGFDKISEEYGKADSAHKPYIFSTTDHFTLVLPDLTYEEGVTESEEVHIVYLPVPNGTDKDETVLSFCYHKARKVGEIAEKLGLSDSTYLRKNIIGNLERNGYLVKDKVSRTSYYKTDRDKVKEE